MQYKQGWKYANTVYALILGCLAVRISIHRGFSDVDVQNKKAQYDKALIAELHKIQEISKGGETLASPEAVKALKANERNSLLIYDHGLFQDTKNSPCENDSF